MRILVVEDDPNLGALWGDVLERAGHAILLVDNEPEALRLLQRTPFDLVVLDLCLNGSKSLGVATLATYRNPMCKVVVVSGSAEYSRKALFAMSPAVAATIRKPVDIEDLVDVCSLMQRDGRMPPVPCLANGCAEFRQSANFETRFG